MLARLLRAQQSRELHVDHVTRGLMCYRTRWLCPILTSTAATVAARQGVPMNIAIVDAGTHLVAFERMEGAKTTSTSIAIDKAFSAAGHLMTTRALSERAGPSGIAFGMHTTNGGRLNIIAGGVPLTDVDGVVIGAIGCSGGTPDQDEEVCEAAIAALQKATAKL